VPTRTIPAAVLGLIALHTVLVAGAALGIPLAATGLNGLGVIANAACLWLFGESVEDRTGPARFAMFYGTCAAAGALTFRTADAGMTVALAMSAGVAGVIAGHLTLFPRSRVLLWLPLPSGARIVEASSIAVAAVWMAALIMAGAAGPPGGTPPPAPSSAGAAAILVAGVAGALLVRVFTRRERMHPDWWHDRR
jgi:membrane associated rhomboid family serine protease